MSDSQVLLAALGIVSTIIMGLLGVWKAEMEGLRKRVDGLEEWKEDAIKEIDRYQQEQFMTQRKLDRVIDYSRGFWRETRDLLAVIKKGVTPAQEHIDKIESWPSIDDVLKEFD